MKNMRNNIERMEKNAWRVASELAERIDCAPVLSDYIHASVSERAEDSFFLMVNTFQST